MLRRFFTRLKLTTKVGLSNERWLPSSPGTLVGSRRCLVVAGFRGIWSFMVILWWRPWNFILNNTQGCFNYLNEALSWHVTSSLVVIVVVIVVSIVIRIVDGHRFLHCLKRGVLKRNARRRGRNVLVDHCSVHGPCVVVVSLYALSTLLSPRFLREALILVVVQNWVNRSHGRERSMTQSCEVDRWSEDVALVGDGDVAWSASSNNKWESTVAP